MEYLQGQPSQKQDGHLRHGLAGSNDVNTREDTNIEVGVYF